MGIQEFISKNRNDSFDFYVLDASARPDFSKNAIDNIISRIAEKHCVTLAELKSRSSKKIYTLPRFHGYRALRDIGWSTVRIGQYFGGRDHSTVVQGLRRLDDLEGVQPKPKMPTVGNRYSLRSQRGKDRLKELRAIFARQGYTTVEDASGKMNLSANGVRAYLNKLIKKGEIDRALLNPDFTPSNSTRIGSYYYYTDGNKPLPEQPNEILLAKKNNDTEFKPIKVKVNTPDLTPKEKRQRYIAEWEARKLAQRGQYSKAAARTYHDRVQP